ncbi:MULTISPECIES: hypothetical protein [Aerosakkonema]|uniref:hypothetical protein n=1 Tax=Aerosakkonema TaxID=1246629 RepID=UPI0035B6CB96
MRTIALVAGGLVMAGLGAGIVLAVSPKQLKQPTLAEAYQTIKSKQFVDLTHAFEPGIPHWKGFPDEKRETLYWYDPNVGKLGSGFWAEMFFDNSPA